MAEQVGNGDRLVGIGGWLILVLIGLVFSPFRIGLQLVQTYAPIFSEGIWQQLTTPSSEHYHPLWAPLLAFEIIGNVLLLAFCLVTLYFFLRKSRYTPKIMIAWLLTTLVFVVGDYFFAEMIPMIAELPADPESVKEMGRAAIACGIWIPYFLVSKRVKATFTH